MKVVLTSALGGYIKTDGKRVPAALLEDNGLTENLRKIWVNNAKVLIICAEPHSYEKNDDIRFCMSRAFPMSGLKATGDEPTPLHAGPFWRFSPRCRRLASARLPPPHRKSLVNCTAWSAKQFLASGFVSGQEKARREYFVYCQGL